MAGVDGTSSSTSARSVGSFPIRIGKAVGRRRLSGGVGRHEVEASEDRRLDVAALFALDSEPQEGVQEHLDRLAVPDGRLERPQVDGFEGRLGEFGQGRQQVAEVLRVALGVDLPDHDGVALALGLEEVLGIHGLDLRGLHRAPGLRGRVVRRERHEQDEADSELPDSETAHAEPQACGPSRARRAW